VIRIGHRGAAALAPENTLASIEAAIDLGVDMVEVDVVPLPDGTLVLAHDPPGGPGNLPTLDEALAFIADGDVGVMLDVKGPGYERALVDSVRRVDLVERIMLTPSGITRLLDGLQSAGLVAKATCESDARVTYAVLTDAGYEKLRTASRSHVADIEAAFARFDEEELELLASLLSRLTAEDLDESCEPE
jgi:DNA-binding MarR family transcriptional regulator